MSDYMSGQSTDYNPLCRNCRKDASDCECFDDDGICKTCGKDGSICECRKAKDSRYPYTYACDLIRSIAGYGADGTKLSRSDASRIRSKIAEIIKMPDGELANKLADYYLENEGSITIASLKDFFTNNLIEKRR